MAVEHVEVQQLPFTIEAIPLKRMQLWSRFAGHASTEVDMDIVRDVYSAFWWELRTHDTVQQVFVWYQSLRSQADAASVVGWLDLLAGEHMTLANVYREVATLLGGSEGLYARWDKDVDERLRVVLAVLAQVRQFGVMLCSQWGLAVPERLLGESVSPTVPVAGESAERL